MDKHITTPITEEVTKDLHSGDYVYINGTIYVARDAAHKRLMEVLDKGEELPFPIKDASITSCVLFPFPIIAFCPKSNSRGAYLSIRLAVVGPADPIGLPSLAGDGPI